ncbi:division/cell wall cluster transcriptional repressor MraZ [Mycoplasmopsis arginini]|uniref:division/cell wall cluster transcriptional repressor MraZ n=1 Tax=Mycoplasmopsis arginini TaxID=2094 RepID=UPI00061CCD3A|nr:division/cell wall cluster transcriptional repressor MraZ [Mycoplasmopsis arginini]CRH46206.1 cell division protein MraZ [Chlamydia trachomatis]MCY2902961.1 division/cell wall cluster transcriptional repressor MraZ [Mycoplasmopsis arginini QMP CG1-2758]MDI3350087.1 division/cell wall cluster transcriptional repressor MraZ [Mycoplasmopsis arginini]MDI3350678.1 division/cell wall cluster transcriptional repressor MraZ [Mycoplasmopsis arginini]MDI3351555.1 division/cell wall cluster transcript
MYGKYERSLDDKNRVVIPPKILSELGDEFFITIGFDKQLILRDKKEFEKLKSRLDENNSLNKDLRELSRFIFANTELVSPDKLNRIIIPKHLTLKTAIRKDVVFIGSGNICELFAKEIYDAKESYFEEESNIDDLAQKLFEQGVKL